MAGNQSSPHLAHKTKAHGLYLPEHIDSLWGCSGKLAKSFVKELFRQAQVTEAKERWRHLGFKRAKDTNDAHRSWGRVG